MAIDEVDELLAMLTELRGAVVTEAGDRFREWPLTQTRAGTDTSLLNLAAYLALRSRDLRPVQHALAPLGLSSLGRIESRVLPQLDAVIAALQAIGGGVGNSFPGGDAFYRGEQELARSTAELFGPASPGREVRILVTCPSEAATDMGFFEPLLAQGVEAIRINCAHDGPDAWRAMVRNLRTAEAGAGRGAKVLMDLAGPTCRTGEVVRPKGKKRLSVGDSFRLVPPGKLDLLDSGESGAECDPAQAIEHLRVADPVLIDDGKGWGHVAELGQGWARVAIDRAPADGLKLKPQKGLNFPGTDLALPPLDKADLAALDVAVELADLIGYSFVQSADDVRLLQDELRRRRPDDWQKLGLVAKIETPRAVRQLPEIIAAAVARQPFAVMIARGDLAVEIGFERLAEMQEEIMWLCEAASVPAIWATQFLESLVKTGLPSRGEMTDAAMSARTECVMLNKGPHLLEAVQTLDRLLARMGEHQHKKTARLRALRSWSGE